VEQGARHARRGLGATVVSAEPPVAPVVVSLALDGVRIEPEQAAFLPLERGLQYGDGLFESLLVSGDYALGVDRHFARMAASAAALGFPSPSRAAWDAGIAATLAPVRGEERPNVPRSMRITWTRGATRARAYAPTPEDGLPRLLIALYDRGIGHDGAMMTSRTASIVSGMEPGDLARHKTLSAMTYVVAQARARERGADEALLVDAEGRVLEAAGSNVFANFGADGLWTPPLTLPILPGLTRARVLEKLPNAREGTFTADDLLRADEVFLTNAVRGIVPIRSLDGRPVGGDRLGRWAIEAFTTFQGQFLIDAVRAEAARKRAAAPEASA
jgi:branched-chain amino acid aminotransferase